MSDIQLYDTNIERPIDVVQQLGDLAMRGPRQVMEYTMALERLPEAEKQARIAAITDMRAKSNIEFLELYVGQPKTQTVLVRNSDGTPFLDKDGDLVWEEVIIPHAYQALIDQLSH